MASGDWTLPLVQQQLDDLHSSGEFSLRTVDLKRLFGLNNAQGLLRGAIAAPRGGLTWVWQLSMPVMTICALVAMHIVLFLLDVVFRWVPFAKIVFPLPRRDL